MRGTGNRAHGWSGIDEGVRFELTRFLARTRRRITEPLGGAGDI